MINFIKKYTGATGVYVGQLDTVAQEAKETEEEKAARRAEKQRRREKRKLIEQNLHDEDLADINAEFEEVYFFFFSKFVFLSV